ncbi:16022_t:CDS:2, partial [Dentiscutata heterogama]
VSKLEQKESQNGKETSISKFSVNAISTETENSNNVSLEVISRSKNALDASASEELCSEKVRPKVPLEQNSKSVLIQSEETKVSHDYI